MCSVPAKMPNKYFIYAGGRWCEVDLRRGRVEGFRQRARFCYLRGGRLEVGRTASVLRALRALAAGAGGAARDSAPLYYRRPRRVRQRDARAHHCCSQHLGHSRCDVNANELGAKPTAAQESTPHKRKRSTSEEPQVVGKQPEEIKSPQKAVDREQQNVTKKDDSKDKRSPQKKPEVKVRGNEEKKIVKTLLGSNSSEDHVTQTKSSHTKPGPLSSKNKQIIRDETRRKQKTVKGREEEKLIRSLLQTSSDNEQITRTRPKSTPQLKSDSESGSSSEDKESKEMCKELVIDDQDVRMLRGFLGRTAGREELERFDNDEEYKTRVFYKLNPLVCVKRCGALEKLLTQRLTIKEFARHLGLRSVADVTPEKRYRMRHSTRQARNTASITSGSEKDVVQPKRRRLWNRDKELFSQSSRSSEIKVKPQLLRPTRDSSRDTTDSDTEVKQHIRKHLERRASAKLNSERKDKIVNKKNDDTIVVESDSDETDTDNKPRRSKRKSTKEDNKSVVAGDDNSSNTDSKQRITRRRSNANKSILVSDEESSNIENHLRKSRRKSKSAKENYESVLVSDENDSGDRKRKSRNETRAKSKAADDASVVIGDESEESASGVSNTDTTDSVARTTRRTRSQGPEKRVLREHNKSVIIGDTDNNTHREKSRTKPKETDEKQKSVSNSNKDKDQIKSKDINRSLKEDKTNIHVKKDDKKLKGNEDSSNETKKVTRSSMRTDNDDKDKKDKVTESSKKVNAANKKKEGKPGSSKRDVKHTKETESKEAQDKSVVSDSSDAFETSKHSIHKVKNEAIRNPASNLLRSNKGRFLKQKHTNTENRTNERVQKANENSKDTTGHKEGYDKNKTKSQTDIVKNKVLKDRIGDKESASKTNNKTENVGKENSRKAAALRGMLVKPVKYKKSSVANGREYTSLEDHAIVAWVSVGNRERLVNGNVIWRELQGDYHRLTSQTRSWHSLRNRYLRYILPALGQLALPPAQVSRLRAAAAVGKIKNAMRSNPIFKQQRVISASTAGRPRFRPPSTSDSDRDTNKAATPPPPRRRPAASPSKPLTPKPSPSKASSKATPSKVTPSKATPASPPVRQLRARSSAASATPTPRKKPTLRL